MIPGAFEYHRAGSISEAVELLAANQDARLLAGGHSLLPMMKLRLASPAVLIDIGDISELSFINADDGQLTIGATTTHAEVAASDTVQRAHAALAEAAASIGDVQVRNCGTLGGSVAHADPAADYAAALMALDAEIDVVGLAGERSVNAADLFTGLLQTSLEPGELIVSVRFPSSWRRLRRRAKKRQTRFRRANSRACSSSPLHRSRDRGKNCRKSHGPRAARR